jgi:hypothetical protein
LPGASLIPKGLGRLEVLAGEEPVARHPQGAEIIRGPSLITSGAVAAEAKREQAPLPGAVDGGARKQVIRSEGGGARVVARAEVGEEGAAIREAHQDVGALHVAVDCAQGVEGLESASQLGQDSEHLLGGGLVLLGPVVQGQAINPLHGEVGVERAFTW